ncbi:methylaspartate mutase, partial [Candidatus Fermentibacteria bacterium]
LIGSGGVLSHAPRRSQAALMVIDAFLPEGITMLAVDSIFMMPQLGVLSEVLPEAATEVFDKDCLIRLGTCIAPAGVLKKVTVLASVTMTKQDGSSIDLEIELGKMHVEPLGVGEKVNAVIRPAKNLDVGNGPGNEWIGELEGGVIGLIFDGRGRPFVLPEDDLLRIDKLQEWSKALNIYPERFMDLEGGE